MAGFQNVRCFVFEQSILFHYYEVLCISAVQNVYNVFYFKMFSMCNFNAFKKQSGIGFIVDALFGYFALHTNFVLIHYASQPMFRQCFSIAVQR